jgi:hypothetical protein
MLTRATLSEYTNAIGAKAVITPPPFFLTYAGGRSKPNPLPRCGAEQVH